MYRARTVYWVEILFLGAPVRFITLRPRTLQYPPSRAFIKGFTVLWIFIIV